MNIPKYMDESTILKMTDNRNVFKDGLLWGANHVGLRAALGAVEYVGSEYTNFWKNEEKEVRKYNIGFTTAYQDIYYSLCIA